MNKEVLHNKAAVWKLKKKKAIPMHLLCGKG